MGEPLEVRGCPWEHATLGRCAEYTLAERPADPKLYCAPCDHCGLLRAMPPLQPTIDRFGQHIPKEPPHDRH